MFEGRHAPLWCLGIYFAKTKYIALVNVLYVLAQFGFVDYVRPVCNNPSSKTSGSRLRRCLEHGRPPAVYTYIYYIRRIYRVHEHIIICNAFERED